MGLHLQLSPDGSPATQHGRGLALTDKIPRGWPLNMDFLTANRKGTAPKASQDVKSALSWVCVEGFCGRREQYDA